MSSKGFVASNEHDFLDSDAAKTFIARMLLVMKTSSVKNPVFRNLLTPPQGDEEVEIPIDYEAGSAKNFPRGGSRANTRSAAPTEGIRENFARSSP